MSLTLSTSRERWSPLFLKFPKTMLYSVIANDPAKRESVAIFTIETRLLRHFSPRNDQKNHVNNLTMKQPNNVSEKTRLLWLIVLLFFFAPNLNHPKNAVIARINENIAFAHLFYGFAQLGAGDSLQLLNRGFSQHL